MTLCSTGSLSICGTAGTNRSISTEVSTGSGSLSALSISADKSAPHSMLEFYGYASVFPISLSSICSCNTATDSHCLSSLNGGHCIGSCYCLTIGYNIFTDGIGTNACTAVICNSTVKYSRNTDGVGTFSSFIVQNTDCVCICTYAHAFDEGSSASASGTINTILCIAGSSACYCIGSPSSQNSSITL